MQVIHYMRYAKLNNNDANTVLNYFFYLFINCLNWRWFFCFLFLFFLLLVINFIYIRRIAQIYMQSTVKKIAELRSITSTSFLNSNN